MNILFQPFSWILGKFPYTKKSAKPKPEVEVVAGRVYRFDAAKELLKVPATPLNEVEVRDITPLS